jgi:hypothetical protein
MNDIFVIRRILTVFDNLERDIDIISNLWGH